VVGGVLVLVLVLVTACPAPTTDKATVAASQQFPVGVTRYPRERRAAAPTVSGTTLDGGTISTAQLPGRVVVINVWASWCEPCRSESPVLAKAQQRWAPAGVHFVGLDENDDVTAATAFLHAAGVTYPQLVDGGTLLSRFSPWLPDAVPSTLVIDRQGRVAARVVGAVSAEQIEALVTEAVAP
jgi:thiol-disulfide isomerase/thioredoxin